MAAAATEEPPLDLRLNTDYLFLKIGLLVTRQLDIQIRRFLGIQVFSI